MNIRSILLTSAFYQFIHYLREKFFTQQLLLNAIILFCVLIICLITFILLYLLLRRLAEKRKIFFQNEANNFIGEIAICETEEELNAVFSQTTTQKIIVQFKKSSFDRNLLITELAETCKKFRGNTMDNIHWLFNKIELESEVLKNLNSKQWHTKAKAIQQMAYLQQQTNIKDIFPFSNHEHTLVRMEAQIAIVKLIGFDGLDFLNVATYPISEWQQLRLIQELSGKKAGEFENIIHWLRSENDTVVHFALRLVEIYRLYQYYDEVAACLLHPSPATCKRAVETLSHISNETTAALLVKLFPRYDTATQMEILKILQTEGTESEIPFLLSLLDHPDDSFKMAVANAIHTVRDSGIENIEALIDELSHPWNVILPQIKMESIL